MALDIGIVCQLCTHLKGNWSNILIVMTHTVIIYMTCTPTLWQPKIMLRNKQKALVLWITENQHWTICPLKLPATIWKIKTVQIITM